MANKRKRRQPVSRPKQYPEICYYRYGPVVGRAALPAGQSRDGQHAVGPAELPPDTALTARRGELVLRYVVVAPEYRTVVTDHMQTSGLDEELLLDGHNLACEALLVRHKPEFVDRIRQAPYLRSTPCSTRPMKLSQPSTCTPWPAFRCPPLTAKPRWPCDWTKFSNVWTRVTTVAFGHRRSGTSAPRQQAAEASARSRRAGNEGLDGRPG
ncbi:hypothetical protein, partial [Crossiella equi]